MPEMDGCTATKKILEHYQETGQSAAGAADASSQSATVRPSAAPVVVSMSASVLEEDQYVLAICVMN